MMTCWIMWTKKKCSSPSASIGELSAITTSAIPVQNDTRRKRGTGVPARGERPGPLQIERGDDQRRRDLERLEAPRGQQRGRRHSRTR